MYRIELLIYTGGETFILGAVASVNHEYTRNKKMQKKKFKEKIFHIFLILCSIAVPICFWCINALEIFADKTRKSVLEAGNVQKSP